MISLFILPGPVDASAWVQNEDEFYVRASVAYEDHNGFTARRTDLFGEYGFDRNFTLSAKYEDVDFARSNVFDSKGWRFSARRKIWTSQLWSSSFEFGVLEGAAIGGRRGCETIGAEAGFAIGRTLEAFRSAYTNLKVSRREHEGCFHDRIEWVLSLENKAGWRSNFQYWGERGENDRSDKIEFTRSRPVGKFEFGYGLRQEISGEFDETASLLFIAYSN